MAKPLSILIVEDNEDDTLLLLRELRKGGYEPLHERVEDAAGMRAALAEDRWDAVISDYILPRFSGLAALNVLKESGLDLPFIIVSGNIGEDIAVSAMKAGAHDYIIKGNLSRLVPAIERELREAESRRERGRAERDLRSIGMQYRMLFENSQDAVLLMTPDGAFLAANSAACRIMDMTEAEILGLGKYGVVDPSDERVKLLTEERQRTGRSRGEINLIRKDGSKVPCEISTARFTDQEGNAFVSIIARDITERKLAEENLSRLNRLYVVLSKVNEAIVRLHEPGELYDLVCRIVVEEGLFKMAWVGLLDTSTKRINVAASHGDAGGYLDGITIIADNVPEGMGPTGRAVVEGRIFVCGDIDRDPIMGPWRDRALSQGFSSSASLPLRSGAEVIGAFTAYAGTPQFFVDREIDLLSALAGDISFAIETMANEKKRKEIESQTAVTDALLKLFTRKFPRKDYLDAACGVIRDWSGVRHVGIRIADPEQHIPFASCRGYSDAFLEVENALSLAHDRCICTRVIAGEPGRSDLAAMTPGGSFYSGDTAGFVGGLSPAEREQYRGVCMKYGFLSLAVIPIRYRDRPIGAIHLADERAGMLGQAAVAFLEQLAHLVGEAIFRFGIEDEQLRLMSAVEAAVDAVVITEPERGTIVYVNDAFEKMTGYSREEAVGRNIHLLDSGRHDGSFYRELRETLARDGVWRGRLINKKKDGTLYFEDCTYSPVRGADGGITNYVSVKRDITERLRLESIAESVNTMNNIGYVFSGVRHEIGNPVNSVKMTLSLLQHKLETLGKGDIGGYLERAMGEIGRVEHLLKSLKNFNLYETPELESVRIGPFLDKFLKLIAEDFAGKGIALEKIVHPGAERVTADPRALQQVLLNIVTNAADALAGRNGPRITFSVQSMHGRVLIRVADNGCGMTEQQRRDLFKPFYTSKPRGTGLGLVIVKKMLSKMDGDIGVASHPNEGTTVIIDLPEGAHAEAR